MRTLSSVIQEQGITAIRQRWLRLTRYEKLMLTILESWRDGLPATGLDAAAAVERNRAEVALAEQELARTSALYDGGIVSLADLDVARRTQEVARANATSAQASLERAEQNLAYATIYSPIDGVVVQKNIVEGKQEPLRAIMTRKLRLSKGSQLKILKQASFAVRMISNCTRVDTEFVDERGS